MSEHTEAQPSPLAPYFNPAAHQAGAAPALAARADIADTTVLSSIAAVFTTPLDLGLDLLLPDRPSFMAQGGE